MTGKNSPVIIKGWETNKITAEGFLPPQKDATRANNLDYCSETENRKGRSWGRKKSDK